MKTRLLLPLLLLLLPWGVYAQSATVSGVVRARADRMALPGVTVLEKGTTNGTSTNAQGRFTLVVPRSSARLLVSGIGYLPQEVVIAGRRDSVVVVLAEDKHTLSEVVVVGYAATEKRSVSGAVSTVSTMSSLAGKTPGVMIRGSSSVSAASRAKPTTVLPRKEGPGAGVGAGTLTAGEVNDFAKWNLWPDIAQQDLREWRDRWQIRPLERYTAQLVTEDGYPVVGATVLLKDRRDSLLWQAQSDNTGKCELWNRLFAAAQGTTAEAGDVASLQAVVDGKTYAVRHPTRFQEGVNIIRVQRPCRAPSVIDIAFVVDATGSMGDEIQYLQAEVQDVISQVKDSMAAATVNVGSIFYRDAGDEYVTRKTDLSANIQQTVNFIQNQRAGGGGDTPEAVEQALALAVDELSWSSQARARLLFLILDAPPHENAQVLASLQRSIQKAAARGIRLIPIAASGIDKSTEYLMRAMALATNGTYVFLTDDSGVGNAHIKPTTDKFNVERLNTLLVRLITSYAYTTDCQVPSGQSAGKPGKLSGRYTPAKDSVAVTRPSARRGKGYAWTCYPNPTSDVLHVEVEGEIKELFITDVTGKILLRAAPVQHHATLQLGSFPTGIYFLTFFTGQKWEKAKFLVSR